MLPGAADVRIFGERQVSMRINLDRTRLAAYKLTVQDVEDAMRRQNAEMPAGRIESHGARVHRRRRDRRAARPSSSTTSSSPTSAATRCASATSARSRSAPVDERVISRYNGKPSLNIGVIKQAAANPLELSKAVRAEVAKINEDLPPGMKLDRRLRHVGVHRPLDQVGVPRRSARRSLLVVLVIFFFLRTLRATIIPLVTIPVSLIGAFALMYAFGFTINTLTLLAMVLAIGLVVDDAIVVLENIYRHIEEGMAAHARRRSRARRRSASRSSR